MVMYPVLQLCVQPSASTVGTGNIIGVSTAIKVGGPGALFWTWMAAFFGMATNYVEGLLGSNTAPRTTMVQYRRSHALYPSRDGRKVATTFCFVCSSRSIGCSLGESAPSPESTRLQNLSKLQLSISPVITALVLSVFVAIAVFGGFMFISKVSTTVVPFMAVFYILVTLTVLFFNIGKFPGTIALVFTLAFSPLAAVGGFAGAGVRMAIQNGVARGVFSNESCLGSAPVAAVAAMTN